METPTTTVHGTGSRAQFMTRPRGSRPSSAPGDSGSHVEMVNRARRESQPSAAHPFAASLQLRPCACRSLSAATPMAQQRNDSSPWIALVSVQGSGAAPPPHTAAWPNEATHGQDVPDRCGASPCCADADADVYDPGGATVAATARGGARGCKLADQRPQCCAHRDCRDLWTE